MGYETVGKLIDKWVNDPKFRTELRQDPESAVRKAGTQLTSEEWEAFKSVDWSLSDQELQTRVTKIPL